MTTDKAGLTYGLLALRLPWRLGTGCRGSEPVPRDALDPVGLRGSRQGEKGRTDCQGGDFGEVALCGTARGAGAVGCRELALLLRLGAQGVHPSSRGRGGASMRPTYHPLYPLGLPAGPGGQPKTKPPVHRRRPAACQGRSAPTWA